MIIFDKKLFHLYGTRNKRRCIHKNAYNVNNPSQCVYYVCSYNRELFDILTFDAHSPVFIYRIVMLAVYWCLWMKHEIDQFQHWTIVISTGMRYTWPSVFFSSFNTMFFFIISNAFLSQLSDCRHCLLATMVRLSTGRQVVLCCNV